LCFEHVDNLGAYSIPSETGLLIPSGYSNYQFPARSVPPTLLDWSRMRAERRNS
jgi:hypothetical protein